VHWLTATQELRDRRAPGVLVTLVSVRGHAPRDAGAKMVVSAEATWGTIGGGNLEQTAIETARRLLDQGATAPQQLAVTLSDKARTEHGRQCCGGEVGILLEPLTVVPSVAVFGAGHVGQELARILSRHDLDLHLVDSREEQLAPGRMPWLTDAVARVHVHHSPLPEMVLDQLPAGTHVLVMTHDHAEDHALCDAALRCSHLATIGLIGSSAKWSRFERGLLADGHRPEAVVRVRTPIGLPDLAGKEPATIAVAVAADLLRVLSVAGAVSPAEAPTGR
jgi:xanthine dehydrogenase accessory factor